MSSFVEAVVENDAITLEQGVVELLEDAFGDWEPAEGNIETFLTKAFARIASSNREQAARISKAALKRFGESIAEVPPVQAAPATVASTWTTIDSAGYTIPAGTLVTIAAAGDETFGFRTVADVAVEAGKSATAAGAVTLRAVVAGEAANELTADPTLSDSLAFVLDIALVGETTNGSDAEDEDEYLIRLVKTLRTLSLSLIVGQDFEIDALGMPPVAYALCIEAWDADAGLEAALHTSVYAKDAAGAPLSAPNKLALVARQQAKVPSGVLVHAADATYTAVKVKAPVAVLAGFDPNAVKAAVSARLSEYLAKANWGAPSFGDVGSSGGWVNRTTVYRNELISEVDRVAGVDRVGTLELAKEGSGFGTADVSLPGKVSVTEPGTIEVSVL